ncbi:MAG: multidrug effflux MFS transporter [Alphaproteobacteria bacterium]|nr:multidrug effflux MFS transporter [Alphaproteobacteria bacterium]
MTPPSPPRLPPFLLIVIGTWIAPFSMHIVIPMMPSMAAEFGTDFAAAQGTLTAYLFGIAFGQLIYGPISDRLGRRPVMLAGLSLYLAAAVGCALATSIEALTLLRLVQGGTGCAGLVLGRAIIRDCYERDRAASLIGYVTTVMAVGAAFSPLAGALAVEYAGWRTMFVVLAALSAVIVACGAFWLNETNLNRDTGGGIARVATSYLTLLRAPRFVLYSMCGVFSIAGWYAFVSGAPYVLTSILGLPPIAYGKYILLVVAGYSVGSFAAGRLSVRIGGERMLALGQAIVLAATAVQLGFYVAGVLSPLALFLPMMVVTIGAGIFLPNASAGAISVVPGLAGSASGLMGFLQMGFGALCTIAMGVWLRDSEGPLILTMAALALLSLLSLVLLRFAR